MKRVTQQVAVLVLLLSCMLSVTDSWHGAGIAGAVEEPKISKESIDILTRTNQALAEVAAAVKPAVVNISTSRKVKSRQSSQFFDDPMFRRFFGDESRNQDRQQERRQMHLGSGVIVDRDGFILTNNHVVKGADDIRIRLSDKREFKGKLVGTDPKTDIAVIKIDSNRLPSVKLGDSDRLRVGEMVIAIGNPFGLNQTVTSGIVSATGRANVGIADYEDFIQTDAPINPGNSGGALINVRGELVGINTAIFSTSGGYQGIGFAIPSNMARVVMDNLVKKGRVVRGYLGVSMQPITPEIANQLGVRGDNGALVGDVVGGSPAEKAGIRRGDVITEYGGKEFGDAPALRNMVATTAPGKEVVIKLLRDGKPVTVKTTITEIPQEARTSAPSVGNNLRGVSVQDLTPESRKRLGVARKVNGVIVTAISEDAPAAGLLKRNDIIMEVERKATRNVKDYLATVSKIKEGRDILLHVHRNGSSIYLTVQAEGR